MGCRLTSLDLGASAVESLKAAILQGSTAPGARRVEYRGWEHFDLQLKHGGMFILCMSTSNKPVG
jgi:hypothetical protein